MLTLQSNYVHQLSMIELKKYLTPDMLAQWHELIDRATNIVVIGHAGPDGDAMGSILGMTHYLQQIGKQATPMTPNPCPDFLRWLPGSERVIFARTLLSRAQAAIDNCDLIICLDFSGLNRIEELGPMVEAATVPKIVIDHHLNPEHFADLLISDPKASATCEMVFCVLHQLGAYDELTLQAATCIYCGIMTDTGAFAFNSNRASLFLITAMLIEKGIDKDQIYRNVFYNYSESRLRLMGYILNQKMIYIPSCHAAIYALTEQEMKQYNFIRGDAEGFVNLPLQIKGTKLSISLREDTEKPVVRVSLRSVGNFPCNEMAARFFNGGGHHNAAGGSLPKPIDRAIDIARQAVEAYRDQLA